jgi:hypothetical protein
MPEVSGFAREAIAQILEWSAEAQVARRKAANCSPAFYTLTGSVAAYAKVLALLMAWQRAEEFYATSRQSDVTERDALDSVDAISNYKGPSQYVAEKLSRLWAALG